MDGLPAVTRLVSESCLLKRFAVGASSARMHRHNARRERSREVSVDQGSLVGYLRRPRGPRDKAVCRQLDSYSLFGSGQSETRSMKLVLENGGLSDSNPSLVCRKRCGVPSINSDGCEVFGTSWSKVFFWLLQRLDLNQLGPAATPSIPTRPRNSRISNLIKPARGPCRKP